MLPKRQRLTKKELQSLLGRSFRVSTQHLSLKAIPNALSEGWKVSVSVPKKAIKKAHERTKTRRRVFGVLKDNKAPLPLSYALIFQVISDISSLSHTDLQTEILNLIDKAKIEVREKSR